MTLSMAEADSLGEWQITRIQASYSVPKSIGRPPRWCDGNMHVTPWWLRQVLQRKLKTEWLDLPFSPARPSQTAREHVRRIPVMLQAHNTHESDTKRGMNLKKSHGKQSHKQHQGAKQEVVVRGNVRHCQMGQTASGGIYARQKLPYKRTWERGTRMPPALKTCTIWISKVQEQPRDWQAVSRSQRTGYGLAEDYSRDNNQTL